jgi:pyruvate ferredoxin oxidoreductase gamma subunit
MDMEKIKEIRWHARGGQGAKTAATLLAEAAIHEGKYSQGFPEYGPERMGAPMRGYTRIAGVPIRRHCPIEEPDIVVVLDESLLETAGVCDGLPESGTLIVNSKRDPAKVRESAGAGKRHLWVVDATGISLDEFKRDIPNTPMIGALIKATGILELETVLADIEKKFSKKFKKSMVDSNLKAIKRAYEEVVESKCQS